MSTSTGPGRPVVAMWYAAAIVAGMSSARLTRKECLVMGIVMPTMSASWNASVPMRFENTWPVIASDRHRVHVGVGDRGDEVGRTGARGRDRDAELAATTTRSPRPRGRRPARGARGCGGACVLSMQRVVDGEDRAAGQAEDVGDAEQLERADDRLGSRDLHGRALAAREAGDGTGVGFRGHSSSCSDGRCVREAQHSARRRAFCGGTHELRVLREDATGIARGKRSPALTAGSQLGIVDQ